jgi:hypothetical protein
VEPCATNSSLRPLLVSTRHLVWRIKQLREPGKRTLTVLITRRLACRVVGSYPALKAAMGAASSGRGAGRAR